MFRNTIQAPHSIEYIIDTDIGGDIDDSIALLLALQSDNKPLAITTTHFDPQEKARITKTITTECGFPDIPIYAGEGSDRTESKEEFFRKNSLFPAIFGYPNPGPQEKKWYEKHGAAYRDHYKQFQSIKIEKESAPNFIAALAKKYSSENKLTIVALGPLHNIALALKKDPSIANNIRLVAMGGLYPKGYNWLISPETSQPVLSKIETICISSDFINQNNLSLTLEQLNEIEKNTQSLFGKTLIADWKNWNKTDVLGKAATFLYDPVTLYLALHPEEITAFSKIQITFTCLDSNGKLKKELQGSWYFKPGLENQIIHAENCKESNITFVDNVRSPDKIKKTIFDAIKTSLKINTPEIAGKISMSI